jgi:hypothetical protein
LRLNAVTPLAPKGTPCRRRGERQDTFPDVLISEDAMDNDIAIYKYAVSFMIASLDDDLVADLNEKFDKNQNAVEWEIELEALI